MGLMKNGLRTILVFGLAAVCVLATAQAPYANQQLGFSVTPPAGWEQKSAVDAVISFLEPTSAPKAAPPNRKESNKDFINRITRSGKNVATAGVFRTNITISVAVTTAPSAAKYANETRPKTVGLKSYKILGEKAAKLGGLPAIVRGILLTMPNSTTVRTTEVFCVRAGKLFTITLATQPATAPKYAEIFNRVISSFVWK